MEYLELEDLIGKTIVKVAITIDQKYIFLTTSENEQYDLEAQVDCCNSVWFEHLTGVDNLIDSTILDFEEKEWEEVEDRIGGDECEEKGFYTFKTTKGYFDIELRNNHNGYYGGSIGVTKGGSNEEYISSEIIELIGD